MTDGQRSDIDLTDRLRFAAGSLAADFGEELPFEYAEALVFRSAEGLLAAASVTEFVPILAERRARLEMRAAPRTGAPPAESRPSPPAARSVAPAGPPAVEPLLAVPERDLTRLHHHVERLHRQVADLQARVGRATS